MKFLVLAVLLLGSTKSYLIAQSADALIERAGRNLDKNYWDQAYSDFKQVIQRHETSLSNTQKANIFNNLGFLALKLLERDQAKQYFQQSLKYHGETGYTNKSDYVNALQNAGLLYIEIADFDKAKIYIQSAIDIISEDSKNNTDYALARTKLARVFEEAGSLNDAFEIYQESYKSIKALGDELSPDFAEMCSHMGRILIRSGLPRDAEVFINKSTEIYEQLGPTFDIERAESLEGLGIFYERIGRYPEAEKILLEALAIKRSIPNRADILIIETLNDLGILYQNLGNLEKAENMFLEVVKECEETVGKDHPFYATAKNNMATIAIAYGEYEDAKTLLTESLQIYEQIYGKDHPLVANTLNNLARVERNMGNNSLALAYYRQVLELDEKIYGNRHPDYATTMINLGILLSTMGRESQAEYYYEEALSIRKEVLGEKHPSYGRALNYMGLHHLVIGEKLKAEGFFREAIEIQIEQISSVFPVMTENERELFYETVKNDIDRYNYLAYELLPQRPHLIKTIFDFRIKTKAILFNSSSKVREKVQQSSNQELQDKYRAWQREKRALADYYLMGVVELEQLNVDLDALANKVESLEKELVLDLQGFKATLPQENENWQSVQNLISKDEAVVEIIRIREFKAATNGDETVFGFTDFTQYLAIIFSSGQKEPTYAILGDDFRTEEEQYIKYRNSMLFAVEQNETFDLFWRPIHEKIKGVNSVKVAPDGIFFKMNPNTFQLPSKEYLIDEYYTNYITSCKDLFRDKVELFQKKSFLFGNPSFVKDPSKNPLKLVDLPGAESEIKAISSLLASSDYSSRSFINENASELRIRSAFNPTILHIATHGFFEDDGNFISSISPIDNPFFKSGLYLSGASDTYGSFLRGISKTSSNDGILTAYEAMNLDLNRTRLVILSACESGLGDIKNGEGVYGLQRAFMVAGARNIITSLAKVDDEATNQLMTLFYEKFIETEEISTSLRYAQIKLKETYKDPRIWGSFILIGNG